MVSVDVTLLQKRSEFFNELVCDFSFTFFFLNNVISILLYLYHTI